MDCDSLTRTKVYIQNKRLKNHWRRVLSVKPRVPTAKRMANLQVLEDEKKKAADKKSFFQRLETSKYFSIGVIRSGLISLLLHSYGSKVKKFDFLGKIRKHSKKLKKLSRALKGCQERKQVSGFHWNDHYNKQHLLKKDRNFENFQSRPHKRNRKSKRDRTKEWRSFNLTVEEKYNLKMINLENKVKE